MTINSLSITDILHSYERTRLNNKRILQERKDQIYSLIPRISEIDSNSALSYLEAAKKRVLGQDVDSSFTRDTSSLNRQLRDEKAKLLVQAGYPADYLEPIYTCAKCQDTGYIGQNKCSCFIEHIINAFRLACAKKDNNIFKDDISIYFFDKDFSVKKLQLLQNGQIPSWPKGFFDQQANDLAEIIKLGL